MAELIIEYPLAASEQVEYRNGGRIDKYVNHGPGVGCKPNPNAWAFGPYERYLTIDVDVQFMRPNLVTVEREICTVETFNEKTWSEYCTFVTVRRKSMHFLDGDELGAAWPEIELRKMEGAKLMVSQLQVAMRNPWEVPVYCGI